MSTLVQMSQPFAPTPSQLAVAYSVCRGITRSRAKNFYYGFLILPKRKRRALCAVYAFNQRCDDIADDPSLSDRDGLAFRRPNIRRDVKDDVTMGRGNLRGKDLCEGGISPSEIPSKVDPALIPPLFKCEAQRAFENYKAAEELIPLIDEDCQPA